MKKTHLLAVIVGLAAVGMLAADASAMYHPTVGRFIQRDPIGQSGDGVNLYQYARSAPVGLVDSSGSQAALPASAPSTRPAAQPAPRPAARPVGWTRALALGPQWLGDGDPDYVIDIWHNLPQAQPAGAKQVWQVATCQRTYMFLDKKDPTKCHLKQKTDYIIDIVNIGGRKRISDRLAWVLRGFKVCFAIESCSHRIGFDDGKSNYAQQTNVSATQRLATKVSNAMRQPVGTFGSCYGYLKKDNCRCCPLFEKIIRWIGIPDGEFLYVGGVGTWAK